MTDIKAQKPPIKLSLKIIAVLAGIFGVMTLFSGGSVIFGPPDAQSSAGNYMSFVVWFNFLAGFFYIAAAIGIWLGRTWARPLAWFIAGATILTGLAFGFQVMQGAEFEMRTVGAMILRFSVWVVIALMLGKK